MLAMTMGFGGNIALAFCLGLLGCFFNKKGLDIPRS